jgi:hypothetical protein
MRNELRAELARQRTLAGVFKQMNTRLRESVHYDLRAPTEGSVVGLCVVPILRALGWDILSEGADGPYVETYCEYKSRTCQIDVALLAADGLPRVLVEAKRPTDSVPVTSDAAKHQVWGYAHEVCRMHAPLVAVVATDGVRWRVWGIDRTASRIDPTELSVSIESDTGWDEFERRLHRDAVGVGFDAPSEAPVKVELPPLPADAWIDPNWELHGPFPKLGEVFTKSAPKERKEVVVSGWNAEVQRRFEEAHKDQRWGAGYVHRNQTCDACDREIRLGHRCDGTLPAGWAYRLP